jgi:colanic acid/amylovoran biosynthesis protein
MQKRKINIGLIWANPYTGNLGVTALTFSSLFLFEKIAQAENTEFRYFLLVPDGPKNDSFQIGDHRVTVTNLRWHFNGSIPSLIKLLLIKWYQIIGLLRFDIAFDVGAGDSFSDIYGIQRFREINATKNILHAIGKRFILLPQTFGPFKSKEAKEKATASIQKADLVVSRDTESFNYVKGLIPNQQVIESIDMAFFMPFSRQKLNDNPKLKIGINISALLWNGGYTRNNQFNLTLNYRELVIEIINLFVKKGPEVEVFLISHVLGRDYENIENDFGICTELNQTFATTILAPFFTNPIEAKSFISGLDFFVGARMHACIAAFSSEVPVFPLAYSRKFNGLFGETLHYPYYGDLLKSDKGEILKSIESAFINRKELKNQIIASRDIITQKELELLNHLTNAIQRSQ